MTEQWEICEIRRHSSTFITEVEKITFTTRGEQKSKSTGNYAQVMCETLAEGWEPFAVDHGVKYFRRRVS